MKTTNIIKKALVLTLITLFTGGILQAMHEYKKVTKNTILKYLCNQSLTSKMTESYVRARLDFRINHWQNELKKWQEKWNINLDEEVIFSKLSEKCREELQEIPFYIFYTRNNNKLLEYLKNNYFKAVYIFSDKRAVAQKLEEFKIIYKNLGAVFPSSAEATMFLDNTLKHDKEKMEKYKTNDSDYRIYLFFRVIEHELTHVEQSFEKCAIDQYSKAKSSMLKFLITYFPGLLSSVITTYYAYELYNYLQKSDDMSTYIYNIRLFYSNEVEAEADKKSLKFVECPVLGYNCYKKLVNIDEKNRFDHREDEYREGGYYSHAKCARVLIKRLISEGYLKRTEYIHDENCISSKLHGIKSLQLLYNLKYIDDTGLNFIELRSKL